MELAVYLLGIWPRLAVQFYESPCINSNCSDLESLDAVSHKIHKNIFCGQLVGGENGIGTTFSAIRVIGDRAMFLMWGFHHIFSRQRIKNLQVSHSRDELIEKHGKMLLWICLNIMGIP